MKILVLGSGGREHALVWRLAQSPSAEALFCAPGSDGMEPMARRVDLDPMDGERLVRFCRDNGVGLVVVGPEVPLLAGIVDILTEAGVPAVGPTAAAARLEGSKVFAKEFMSRHGIPTARFATCNSPEEAREVLRSGRFSWPVVIKADGLAAGKGVVIAQGPEEAGAALAEIMERRVFGASGDRVVLEEFLQGEEASLLVFSDGTHVLPLVPAQDHKAVFDGDQGPNTGGMGAYSDDVVLSPALRARVMERIVVPTVQGMAEEGHPFRGVLFVGLMIHEDEAKVLEFNVRFGDPETQVILPRILGDPVPVFQAVAGGHLDRVSLEWDPRPAVTVVMASGGYPGAFEKGFAIEGLERAAVLPDVNVFHAGTRRQGDRFVTAGGRVLNVTARGNDLRAAIDRAYEACGLIRFEGCHFRRDIGRKGLRKLGL